MKSPWERPLSIGELADIVQTETRRAHDATGAKNVRAMRSAIGRLNAAITYAMQHGIRHQLAAELTGRGFGGGL